MTLRPDTGVSTDAAAPAVALLRLALSVPEGRALIAEVLPVIAEECGLALDAAAGSPDDLLTVDEAAAVLKCGVRRIYDLTSQRRLPVCKDGSRNLYRRADVAAYLARETQERAA